MGLYSLRGLHLENTVLFLESVQVIQAAVAFPGAPAAQSQFAKLLVGWHECGGTTVGVTIPGTGTIPFSVSPPRDAGNGVSTMDLVPAGLQIRSARAIATKTNVIVDLYVSCSGTTDGDRPRQSAVSIVNYVLDKIPG